MASKPNLSFILHCDLVCDTGDVFPVTAGSQKTKHNCIECWLCLDGDEKDIADIGPVYQQKVL